MSKTMNVYWMIVRQAFQAGTGGQRFHWMSWTLLAVLSPVALVFGIATAKMQAVAGMLAAAIGFAIFQWSMALFAVLGSSMSRPSQVCLVPGLRQRLVHIVFGIWLVFVLMVGGLYGYSMGQVLVGMLVCAFLINRLAWTFSGSVWHGAGVMLWLLVDFDKAWKLAPPALQDSHVHGYFLTAIAVLLLADGWYAIRQYVAAGGDRQFDVAAKTHRTTQYLWHWDGERKPYAFDDPVRLPASRKLAIGLGLYVTRRQWLQEFAVMAAVMSLLALDKADRSIEVISVALAGLAGTVLFVVALVSVRKQIADVSRTTAEQQLLCLAPGMLQGRPQNRLFLGLVLRQWLLKWVPAFVLVLAVLAWMGAPGGTLRALIAIGLATLCIMPVMLDEDYIRLQPQQASSPGCLSLLAAFVLVPLFGVLETSLASYSGVALGVLLGGYGLFASWRGWHKRVNGAQLLPVGSHLSFGN